MVLNLIFWLNFVFTLSLAQLTTNLTNVQIHLSFRGQFPSVVSIEEIVKRNNRCSGILITKKHVLTVAHCVPPDETENYIVIAGTNSITTWDNNCQTRTIVKAMIHSGYNPTENLLGEDDIAIQFLNHEIFETGFIRITPYERVHLEPGGRLTIVGWGPEKTAEPNVVAQMSFVNVSILNPHHCGLDFLPSRLICLGDRDGTTSAMGLGNAGTPAFLNNKIVAIANRKLSTNSSGIIYLDLSFYNSWINFTVYGARSFHIYFLSIILFILCMVLYILIFFLYTKNK